MSAPAPPSDLARALVRGAVHVHAGPDLVPRQADAMELAARFAQHGLAGFVDKAHFGGTFLKEPGLAQPYGTARHFTSVVLNGFVGGLNPLAVEAAARGGARFVWLPTVDVEVDQVLRHGAPEKSRGTPSTWSAIRDELVASGRARPTRPVTVAGEPSGDLLSVLEVVRDHGLTLATGHLRWTDTLAAVMAARDLGIEHVVVTHPAFPGQEFDFAQQTRLAEHGAVLEYCFTNALTGKVDRTDWVHAIRSLPADQVVVSSDAGQVFNPPVEDCLALAADLLLGAGVDEDRVRTVTTHVSRRVVGLERLAEEGNS